MKIEAINFKIKESKLFNGCYGMMGYYYHYFF